MSTTTTNQPVPVSPAQAAPPGRISLAEYEGWIDSGAIEEGAPIELFEGRIVRKMTKGRKHTAAAVHAYRRLDRSIPAGWHVAAEAPVRMPASAGLPGPDLSVTRGEADDYEVRDPGPADVALVVEVSDSSLAEDRRRAAVYLTEGYPEYWIINVQDRQLEVHRRLSAPEILGEGDSIELVLDGAAVARIAVADMLPRRKAD